ncbi:MAG: amidohydrolase [Burkholderiales bacterium]|nr:amidohydrolase [Burkholderiales bacterium]
MFRLVISILFVLFAGGALAQPADVVLLGGKVLAGDAPYTVRTALAVRGGRVLAVGADEEIARLKGEATRVVELQGRTVIPGLIDSHMHAIRAALSFATEVNWIGAASLEEALGRLREGAKRAKPGGWLIVAGGWTERQFREKRRPTQAELEAAAPGHPVYVQWFYGWAMLSRPALAALKIHSEADLPKGGKLEAGPDGKPTGAITGPVIVGLFNRLPAPGFAEQVEGTRLFFRELNRLGLTGVIDPGGFNMSPEAYQPLFRVWRGGQLTVRVSYSLFAQKAGKEFDEFKELVQMTPMGFGDEWLRFNGLGERITFGMYNNNAPTEQDKDQLYAIARWAAERGMTLTQHWQNAGVVDAFLDVVERVNREIPVAPLRWSIAHLNDASDANLARMKALGIGWTVQDAMYFEGEAFARSRGEAVIRRAPPVVSAIRIGLPAGAGTDAHRVMSYNPFVALQWFLDGKDVSGTPLRGPEQMPTREQALHLYTAGSAWFDKSEGRRGTLAPGKLADLAVLSKDILTAPLSEIGGIESLLTMVGGRVVYAAGPYARLEEK